MTNTWRLYYTTVTCGNSASLSYSKNGGVVINNNFVQVPCGVNYDAYVTEYFINYLMNYYGLLDADIIYVKNVLYTTRWTCNTSTGICSQISSGSGYASEAACKNVFPCNPNQWIINTSTLTGTVSVSGMYLAWFLTPKNGAAANFNFGDYDNIPLIYTDSFGITQIGVYQPGIKNYAMNASYHGGTADFNRQDSDLNIVSKIPGYVWEIQYPKDAIIPPPPSPVCTPSYIGMCRQPLNGYEYDINNCPGSVDKLNSKCNPGTGTGGSGADNSSGIINWFSKKTCVTSTTCIPNWQLIGLGGALFFILTKKKR